MRRALLADIAAEAKAPANGSVEDLSREIAKHEERHGLNTSRLLEELSSGEREETEEILSWLMLARQRDLIESRRTSRA